MAQRGHTYETKLESDGLESLTQKITLDMRKSVRSLGHFDVFSEKWLAMASSVVRIADISEMERALPRKSEDATLWEGEELAMRYLLEDGKLNVLLRALVDAYDTRTTGVVVDPTQHDALHRFEQGAGAVLRNAWHHVEALQTTDTHLLLQHVSRVLSRAAASSDDAAEAPRAAFGRMQEAMALHYLAAVTTWLERLDEQRTIAQIRDLQLFHATAAHILHNAGLLHEEDIKAGCQALATVCEHEDFGDGSAHLASPDALADLCALESVVEPLIARTDPSERRRFRPLSDFVRKCKRKAARGGK